MPSKPSAKAKAVRKKTVRKPAIDASMSVAHILDLFPRAADIMATYGLHCFNCSFSTMDTLEEGVALHGLESDDLQNMLDDLNEAFVSAPRRPATLTVTEPAARALGKIMTEQGKQKEFLQVIADGHGGFCMEFSPDKKKDETLFTNAAVPDVRITANTLTLERIGGSTIDFREGRFKLDMEAGSGAGCDCGDSCACKKREN